MTSRRQFILSSLPAGALLLSGTAKAETVSENDPQAKGLGYKADATKVDKSKYPTYAAKHNCANCMLYSGKPKDSQGPCGVFGGKNVNAKGWCSVWTAKS
jgi:hypothetical protein